MSEEDNDFGSSFDITKYPFNPALAANTYLEYLLEGQSTGISPLDKMPDLTKETLSQMLSVVFGMFVAEVGTDHLTYALTHMAVHWFDPDEGGFISHG